MMPFMTEYTCPACGIKYEMSCSYAVTVDDVEDGQSTQCMNCDAYFFIRCVNAVVTLETILDPEP